MLVEIILIHIFIFIFGTLIGSFTNVLIYRLPKHENFVTEASHCMSCGHRLKWYDLVPLFSWLFLGGKCRYCKTKISGQYPLVEAANGIGYVLIFLVGGHDSLTSILYCILHCLCFSILLTISVIDARTYEIPVGLNIAIGILGIIHLIIYITLDVGPERVSIYEHFYDYLIGAVCVSGFLLLLFIITGGRGIGGGDIKLMAAAGLLLGWKHIIPALMFGAILGSIIHIILMKVSDKDRKLAFGPYLSAGIVIMILVGDRLIDWYTALIWG